MAEIEVGKVTHYFNHIGVAVIELIKELKVGDRIHIHGHTSDFEQEVDSIQIEHENFDQAKAGQTVGLKVADHVRVHDTVYKIK